MSVLKHPVTARVVTALAALLVILALIGPDRLTRVTPTVFLRIPVEALVAVAILLVLPARPRRVVAAVFGALLLTLAVLVLMTLATLRVDTFRDRFLTAFGPGHPGG